MLHGKTYFEQVPLAVVQKILEEQFVSPKEDELGTPEPPDRDFVESAVAAQKEQASVNPEFDIFRKEPEGGYIWLEAVMNLGIAEERVRELSGLSFGEFLIFHSHSGKKLIVRVDGQRVQSLESNTSS